MSQQEHPQPGWATPQPDPEPGTPQPKKKRRVLKIVGFWCLGALGLFILLGVIGEATGAGKSTNSSTSTSPSPTKSDTTASAPAKTKPSAKPKPSQKTAAPAKAVATPLATKQDTTEARKKAAAILHANDAYYQDEFNRGVTVVLNRGNPDSYPAFHSWYDKAATDVQPGTDAFKKADAYFNADNEPASISDWQADNGNLSADIAQLATDGLGVGGPDDETYRQKVQEDVAKFPHDFQTAEADADKVAAGK